MRIKFFIPRIEKEPEGCPEECPHCGCRGFHIHQHVEKNVIDHIVSAVKATRHKCKACKRTLRECLKIPIMGWQSEAVPDV